MRHLLFATFLLAGSVPAIAQHAGDAVASPYAGEEARDIKSLSEDDIAELRRGGGWGLAKAAELNGMPGPAHLLELKDEIPLTAEQVTAIEAIFEEMRADAISEGEHLIALEQALDDAFRNRTIVDESLWRMLADIGDSRTALRMIHLATHLRMPELLTDEQIARYNELRGYSADPCDQAPPGHDPALWRKHNGCG
jgi:hypothetical protein